MLILQFHLYKKYPNNLFGLTPYMIIPILFNTSSFQNLVMGNNFYENNFILLHSGGTMKK